MREKEEWREKDNKKGEGGRKKQKKVMGEKELRRRKGREGKGRFCDNYSPK